MAGWGGGWVVGKSDFNENPVVSPDLDLDFGLRLRICQNCQDSGAKYENANDKNENVSEQHNTRGSERRAVDCLLRAYT